MNPFHRVLTAAGLADSISRVQQLSDFVCFIEGFRELLLQWFQCEAPRAPAACPLRCPNGSDSCGWTCVGTASAGDPSRVRMARKVAPTVQELEQLVVDSCETSSAKRLLPATQLRSKETAPPQQKPCAFATVSCCDPLRHYRALHRISCAWLQPKHFLKIHRISQASKASTLSRWEVHVLRKLVRAPTPFRGPPLLVSCESWKVLPATQLRSKATAPLKKELM